MFETIILMEVRQISFMSESSDQSIADFTP